MRWYIWPRQYGKTYRVMQWWLEDPTNRVVLMQNEDMARHHRREMRAKHPELSAWPDSMLKEHIMSYRSWQNRLKKPGRRESFEVALDDCVKSILREYVSPAGTDHDLKIISDAGVAEKPDSGIAAKAAEMHEEMRERYGDMLPEGYDWSTE